MFERFKHGTLLTDCLGVQDLEEQVRDLMFFFEAQKTIEGEGGVGTEASGGDVEIVEKKTRGKKKKKR